MFTVCVFVFCPSSKKWNKWNKWKNWGPPCHQRIERIEKKWEHLHPQRNEKKKKIFWKIWGSLHPQRNERNEGFEGPHSLKEMKEIREIKELRVPTLSKKWMDWEGPHFQRNERNPPPILWKKWKKSFLSWPGLNHNGSLGWPRPFETVW